MKRLSLLLLLTLFTLTSKGQAGAVDDLFEKYAGKSGFTSVMISSKMLGLFATKESDDEELNNVMNRLKSIRILTVEDSLLNRSINFYTELRKKTDFSGYDELMVVREGQNVTFFLTRQSGKTISELLLISGGTSGNTLISIRGDLDLKDISGLSKSMGMDELKALENIEKKHP